jgi:hypothetical protein
LTINRSTPDRTREEVHESPQVTIIILPPVRVSEHPSTSLSRPDSPPPDKFPLPSVDILVPPLRTLVPEASYGTREETMTPTSQDYHGLIREPTDEKPTSQRPTSSDSGKGPIRAATSSVTAAGKATKPPSKKVSARPKPAVSPLWSPATNG